MAKINKRDLLVVLGGLTLAILGLATDNHGLSFSGGSFIGAFLFRLGYL